MIIDVTDRFPLVDTTYRWKYDKAGIDADAIHHTATLFEALDLTQEQELAHLAVIYKYHVEYRGMGGIAYHGVSFKSGRRYKTAPWGRLGANVQFENDHLRGWAAVGLFNGRVPPRAQLEGLAELTLEGWRDLGYDVPAVPHLRYGGTSCPGDRWSEWVPKLPGLARRMREEQETMDQATFDKMYAVSARTVKVIPRDDAGKPVGGTKRTLANWVWRLRQRIERLEKTRLRRGDKVELK